ncbi:MAG: hypothetical protein SWQ30_19215 [Thermodesulfobacteriota bacterium]|nr:hypothetical protein [Thermodesulfobacteriota bacterium]
MVIHKPLLREFSGVTSAIAELKERARAYYFEVVLSIHQCPDCGGRLRMTGQSECSCSCGNVFDPTLAFQKSTCCQARLVRRTFHYACSRCHKTVPSRFLFNERVFDSTYFREIMRESRARAKRKRDEIRRFLVEARSPELPLMEAPDLESIPGLVADLDDFILTGSDEMLDLAFETESSFRIDDYREHILSALGWSPMLFSEVVPLIEDNRQDKIWRFITLIFMEHDREVELTEQNRDLLVQRVYHEAYS